MKDDFYHIYANKLKNISVDQVDQENQWKKISSKLPTKEKNRNFILFKFLVILFFTGFAVYLLSHFLNDARIYDDQLMVKKSIEICNTIGSSFQNQKTNNLLTKKSKGYKQKHKKHYRAESIDSCQEQDFLVTSKSTSNTTSNLVDKHSFIETLNYESVSNDIDVTSSKPKELKPFEILPQLDINPFKTTLDIANSMTIHEPSKSVFNKTYLGLGAGYIIQSNQHSKSQASIPQHIFKEKLSFKNGFYIRSSFLFQVSNNIRISSGLDYSVTNYHSHHDRNINMSELNYIDKNHENLSRYSLQYDISDGVTQSRINLYLFDVVPGQHINQNDSFQINMTLTRKVKNLSIPAFLDIKLIQTNRFQSFVRSGFNIGVIQSANTTFEHHSESCEELFIKSGFKPEIHSSTINKVDLSSMLGLVFEYHLTSNTALSITPEIYFQSIKNKGLLLSHNNISIQFLYNLKH